VPLRTVQAGRLRRAGPGRRRNRAAALSFFLAAATAGVPGLGSVSGPCFRLASAAAATGDATATAVLRPRHIVEGEHRRRDDRGHPRMAVATRSTPPTHAPGLASRPVGRAR